MKSASGGLPVIRFGTFELDASAGELRRRGVRIRLQEQSLRILEMLLANPGEIVSREEMRTALWPGHTLVDFDHGLNRAISKLREALGDSAESPRFIETHSKRGYRFLGDLKSEPNEIRSILVLPLENLSQDSEEGYFADGLTEALITTLAKISALRVLSRTTAVFYKRAQKRLPDIARELGVDGVVEGTVVRSGRRVRISAQLLHAPTDTHIWADSYDRDVRDILALQAEVASAIAREIQVKITAHEQIQLARTSSVDPSAYDAYLRGRYHWNKRSETGYRKAIPFFENALAREPQNVAACSGLADCLSMMGWFGFAPPEAGCGKAKMLAASAIRMDPSSAPAHTSLGWSALHYEYDFQTAEMELRRAICLDPLYTVAHYWFGLALTYMGRVEESVSELRCALELEPLSIGANPIMAVVYYCARQFDRGILQSQRTLELYPDLAHMRWGLGWGYLEISNFDAAVTEIRTAVELSHGATHYVALLAEAYALGGRTDEARGLLDHLQGLPPERYVSPYMIGRVYAALDRRDLALRWLETALKARAALMVFLKVDTRLDCLRAEPHYQSLVRSMKFPD